LHRTDLIVSPLTLHHSSDDVYRFEGRGADFDEARDDSMAVASAGPYANYFNLTAERQPCQHLITHNTHHT